jgi:hypothetical protein
MTTIADALAALDDLAHRLTSILARQLPASSKTALRADVMAEGRIGKLPFGQDLAAVADALRGVGSRPAWDALPRQVRALAPWALWLGEPPPIRTPGILGCCRDEAIQARGTARIRSLIGVYLADFKPDRPGAAQLGAVIRAALAGRPLLAVWHERDESFGIFDPEEGPRRVASALFGADDLGEALRTVGLADPSLVGSGFMAAVHDNLCTQLPMHLTSARDGTPLTRLLPFLEEPSRGLRFLDQRASLAASLLLPWISGSTPAPLLRDVIMTFLLRHFHDPRFASGTWHGVPDNCVAVFRQWLARASLEEFFELISDRNDNGQWPYRRAFWAAVAHTGAIEDAWVVLSPLGRRLARGKLGNTIACGEIARGFTSDQSVILIHIGTLIFAEVSHNGRLHAWRVGTPNAPTLARKSYDREDVYRDGLNFPRTSEQGALTHRSPATGWWQERAAELLRSYTGLRLTQTDWRV